MADTKLIIRILTDAKDAVSGVNDVRSKYAGFNDTMKGLVGPATVALGAITALGAGALDSASQLQQSAGSVESVFGDSAAQIKEWSKTAADSVGLAASEYQNFAAVIGAQLKNLGVPMDQVAGGTDQLISLGADLAATFGGSTQQAVEALSSALRGEADPAEKYGLALNQTTINAYLAEQGLSGLEGQALTAAKAQAVMALASEQAGGAIGQFGREADTVSGQQQRLNAKWEDASAALGEALLPVITPVIAALGEFAGFIQENSQWITPLIALIGGLAAAVIAYTAAQWALNAAMTANPIGIIVMAIAALVAGFIALWNSNEDFRNAFITGWEQIVSFFSGVWQWIQEAWNNTVTAFSTGLQQIQSFFDTVFSTIGTIVQNVVNFFKSAWQLAINLVVSYIRFWWNIFSAIFNAIRTAVNAVVNFFKVAWQAAVQAVTNVLKFFGDVARNVFNAIMGPIKAVIGFFNQIVGAIQNVISWLSRIKIPDVFGAIGNFFGGGGVSSRSAAPPAAPPSLFSGRSLALAPAAPVAMGGGSGSTTINVSGGLDSADAIARRIQQVLQARDRRAHGVTITRSLR